MLLTILHLIHREIRNLFIVRIYLFADCSKPAEVLLFKSFCLFYGLSVWKSISAKWIGRFKAAYHKCIKNFIRLARCDSVTGILADLGLPSCDLVEYVTNIQCSAQ